MCTHFQLLSIKKKQQKKLFFLEISISSDIPSDLPYGADTAQSHVVRFMNFNGCNV